MGPSLFRRAAWVACALFAPAGVAFAQGLPVPGGPQPTPLPHPDLAPPEISPPSLPVWLLCSVIVSSLILLGLFIWLLFRTSTVAPAVGPPPLSRAQKRLQQLLLECDTLAPGETAHQVSVVLREYQEGRYHVPAPYLTREELYEGVKANLRPAVQQRFSPLANLSDRLAFAPHPSTKEEARALVQTSLEALQQESYYVTDASQAARPLPSALPPPPPELPPPSIEFATEPPPPPPVPPPSPVPPATPPPLPPAVS